MKELFDVKFNNGASGFTMNLKNGSVVVPDAHGCYVISTGCGSGKTECCKSIIRQKHDEGILYCVDTVAELKKMYGWIMDNRDEIGIAATDVIIISSDIEHQDALRIYKNSPEILMSKKIVLITHVRFWTDLINYFLIYNPASSIPPFDGDFDSLMGRNDLRGYILFDETPTFIKPFFTMPRSFLGCFANYEGNAWKCLESSARKMAYDKFLRGSMVSPFPKTDNRMNVIKRDVILGLIPAYFPQWINATSHELSIAFTPLNLCVPIINTHLLIFEGVGNVLFAKSRYYQLLDVGRKYNCNVEFKSFPFGMKRRERNDKGYADFMKWLVNRLKLNDSAGKKTLVVVWKNRGDGYNTDSQNNYDTVVSDLAKKRINKNSYKVIYFGSAQSKSTNEFRDYSDIILAGVWNLPPSMDCLKQQYGIEVGATHIRLWEFVQLLCRIGIRQHDGATYTVHYSSDYSDIFIKTLKAYLDADTVPQVEVENERNPDWLQKRFSEVKIHLSVKNDIINLAQAKPEILEAIRNGLHLDVDIPLNELYGLIHRSRKKRGEYKALIKSFLALNIALTISQ